MKHPKENVIRIRDIVEDKNQEEMFHFKGKMEIPEA